MTSVNPVKDAGFDYKISSDTQYNDDNVRFTTVSLKVFSVQKWIRYQYFNLQKSELKVRKTTISFTLLIR